MKKPKTGGLSSILGDSFPFIKPLIGFQDEINKQIRKFPFEKNVFLMMRFRDTNMDLSDFIIEILKEAGLKGVRADQPEWNLTNNVYNPIAVLYCCKYGIALFDEAEPNQAYNPNVIYELGMMHSLGRDCLILRNDSLPTVPFDLIKDLYMPYKSDLVVRTNVRKWLTRIVPESVKTHSPSSSPDVSDLEDAAVLSEVNEIDSVVSSPNEVTASDFSWQILSKGKRTWKVMSRIKLTDAGQESFAIKVQVLFLDADGFALYDYTSSPTQMLLPGETTLYEFNNIHESRPCRAYPSCLGDSFNRYIKTL